MGTGLLAVSLATPWWTYSVGFGNGGSNSFAFYPGADYSVACSGSGCGGLPSGSEAYGSHGLAAVGNLYGTVLGVTAAAIVCVILSIALAVVALVRRRRDRRPFVLAGVLAVAGFLLVVGAVAGVVASQPSALGQGAGGIPTAAPSPAASFWGSCQSGGSGSGGACAGSGSGPSESASWGAGLGWYLALAGAVTWLVGLVGLFRRPPREWVLAGVRPPGPSDAG